MVSRAPTRSHGSLHLVSSPIQGLVAQATPPLHTWWERHKERQQLLELDDDMLHDIDLTRGDVSGSGGRASGKLDPTPLVPSIAANIPPPAAVELR